MDFHGTYDGIFSLNFFVQHGLLVDKNSFVHLLEAGGWRHEPICVRAAEKNQLTFQEWAASFKDVVLPYGWIMMAI